MKCQPYSIAKTFSLFVCFLFCSFGSPYQQCSKIAFNFYEKKNQCVLFIIIDVLGMQCNRAYTSFAPCSHTFIYESGIEQLFMDIMKKSFPKKLKECYGKTLFKKSSVFLNPNVVWDLDNLYYKS